MKITLKSNICVMLKTYRMFVVLGNDPFRGHDILACEVEAVTSCQDDFTAVCKLCAIVEDLRCTKIRVEI